MHSLTLNVLKQIMQKLYGQHTDIYCVRTDPSSSTSTSTLNAWRQVVQPMAGTAGTTHSVCQTVIGIPFYFHSRWRL